MAAAEPINYNPTLPFYRNSLVHPDRLALVGDGEALTYGDAAAYARAIANALGSAGRPGARVAILGSRSVAACLAVLGTSWTGATYVPLGLKLPPQRLSDLLRSCKFDALICDRTGEALLDDEILRAAPTRVLLADRRDALASRATAPWRLKSGIEEAWAPREMAGDDLAYVEFTSGTTGVPKGVMITARGLGHYVELMQQWRQLTTFDRVAETSELSFDISVSNMFLTWNAAAALYILPAAATLTPGRFIRENRLTFWYSVPSVIAIMQRTRTLQPGSLPSLRSTIFAGEPLPAGGAEAWLEAAPNSTLDNLYGPTEATVVCLRQVVTKPPLVTPERGIVAIGVPFPGMQAAIVDERGQFLGVGERGEIALSGPQLAAGYLDQPELTEARFPVIHGRRWYLTGDHGYQDGDGVFHHLGRIDNQVKVWGNRVELEEIDVHLRRAGQTMSAAAVAWPSLHGSANGIVAFVAGAAVSGVRIQDIMRQSLPAYMVPSSVVELAALPLNGSGKVDRKALVALLDGQRR